MEELNCIVRKADYSGENTVLQISLCPAMELSPKAEDSISIYPIVNGRDTLVFADGYACGHDFIFNQMARTDNVVLDVYFRDKYCRIPLVKNQDCNATLKLH